MKQKEIMIIVISLFVLVMIWVGLSLRQSAVDSTISELQKVQIQPIDPAFDPDAIEALKQKKQVIPLLESVPQADVASQSAEEPSPQPSI